MTQSPISSPVYMIQPVVKLVECLYTRYNRLSNRLSNRFDNRLDVCLHDTNGCRTGWQPVVSCKQGTRSSWARHRVTSVTHTRPWPLNQTTKLFGKMSHLTNTMTKKKNQMNLIATCFMDIISNQTVRSGEFGGYSPQLMKFTQFC